MGRIFDGRGNQMTPTHATKAGEHNGVPGTPELNDKDLISTQVARVDVKSDHLVVRLAITSEQQSGKKVGDAATKVLTIPWKKTPARRPREIIPPGPVSPRPDQRPIRAETRAKLIASIAKGRQWLEGWIAGTVTSAEQIAARQNCTVRQVNMTISLAFLAPVLVQAAVEGRLPRGVGVANLRDAPAEWSRQHAMLGLST